MNEIIIGIDPDSNGAACITEIGGGVSMHSLRFVAPGEVDLSALSEFLEDCRGGVVDNPTREYSFKRSMVYAYLERQRLVFIPPKRQLPGKPLRKSLGANCPLCGTSQDKSRVAIKSSVTLVKIEYAIRGLLAGMNIAMESIPPGSWKMAFVHGKEAMVPVASRMFPSVVWTGNAKQKEGQATALMLAEWGRREREGRPK